VLKKIITKYCNDAKNGESSLERLMNIYSIV